MDKNKSNQAKGMTNMVSKESSNKSKDVIESVLTIIGVIAFAFIVSFLCKKVMSKDSEPELTIGTNNAEARFYNADYDGAISSYESTKEKDKEEWPMYKVKEAEAYSLKGDYTYSNRLLLEAYDKRNELIRKEGIDKFKDEDRELGNLIVFTALMNGDTEKALEYGEIFLLDDKENSKLNKTLFLTYLANGKTDDAKEMLESLQYDETSAKDLSEIAYMNMVIGDYKKSLECLTKAYKLDKNEVDIYDVLEDINIYHNEKLIDNLKTLSKQNKNEDCYKIFLAKCYSLNTLTAEEAQKILDQISSSELPDIPYKIMQADIYKNLGEKDKYDKIITELIEDEKDNYYIEHIKAKYALENKEYAEGINYAKESIINNRDYVDTYYELMPDLLYSEKESEKAESYIRTALYKEPFNYNILIALANYCANVQKDSDKAIRYYELAVAMDSKNSEVYYKMAMTKSGLKKNDEAKSLLNKAIELNSKEVKYYRKLANIYLLDKESEKAIKTIRKAYDINKDDINTLNDAGYYYMSVGEIDRALTNFKSAFKGLSDSTDVTVRDVITKNYDKAKEYSANKSLWTKSAIDDFKYLD